MKIATASLILATSAVVWTGCENPDGTQNNTGTGAIIGGMFGALAGAAIGGRNAGEGALIGGAAGVAAGALIGNAADQQQNAELRAEAPQTYVRVNQQQPLTVNDVKALIHAGISTDLIINQIGSTHSGFRLSSTDIIDLRDAGASDALINFMINTAKDPYAIVAGSPTVVVADAPPPPTAEVIGVAPGPDYVWVGGNWVWDGRWVWVPGHWGYPPRPHAVWVVAHWERGPHGWYHVDGYWRY